MKSKTAFAVFILVIALSVSCSGEKKTSDRHIAVIGLDAADWRYIEPLAAEGKLPAFSRLMEDGARGKMETVKPVLSPIIWTSVATGKDLLQHGILDFMTTDPRTGRKVPVTGDRRQTKAVWNILTDYGLTSGTIGWLASHPAEKVEGYMVSDRTSILSFYAGEESRSSKAGKTFPPELYDDIENLVVDPADVGDEEVMNAFGIEAPPPEDKLRKLKGIYAQTESYTRIAGEMLRRKDVNLFSIYYEGIDTACHLFIRYTPPQMPGVTREEIERYKDIIPSVYVYFDGVLERLLSLLPPDTTVYVMSDHGFKMGTQRPLFMSADMETPYAEDWHSDEALLLVSGPGIAPNREIAGADVYDITPTLLYQFDIPAGEDMRGEPLTGIFKDEYTAEKAIETVATHDRGDWKEGVRQDVEIDEGENKILEEKLRSLGYLSSAETDTKVYENLAVFYLSEGDTEKALELYKKIIDISGERTSPLVYYHLGQIFLDSGETERAVEYLKKALARQPELVEAVLMLARAYFEQGDMGGAEELLEKTAARNPEDPRFYNYLGSFMARRGMFEKASEVFRKSLDIYPYQEQTQLNLIHSYFSGGEPERGFEQIDGIYEYFSDSPSFLNSVGDIYYYQKRFDRALSAYDRSLDVKPFNTGGLVGKARVLSETGRTEEAGRLFSRAVKSGPEDPALYLEFGINRMKAHDYKKAAEMFRKSANLSPDNFRALSYLGTAYLRLGEPDRAKEYFQKSLLIEPAQPAVRQYLEQIDNKG